MSSSGAFMAAIGVALIAVAVWLGRSAIERRRFAKRRLDSGTLDYWARVFNRENWQNATGDLLLAYFGGAMGLMLVWFGLSGILL